MPLKSKEIKIPLHKGVRPIFSIDTLGGELDCHVYTGSLLPIWFSSEKSLIRHFDAKKTNYEVAIGGLGAGGASISPLWQIQQFKLVDPVSKEEFMINGMLIAVMPEKTYSFTMLLSGNLFLKTDYAFEYFSDKGIFHLRFNNEFGTVPKLFADEEGFSAVFALVALMGEKMKKAILSYIICNSIVMYILTGLIVIVLVKKIICGFRLRKFLKFLFEQNFLS